MARTPHKSGATLRYERQQREARDALAAQAAQVAEVQQAAPAPAPPPGTYRIADLHAGQCRFACTPHTARAEEHRFCGGPVAWLRGKPTSWCAQHLAVISGAPGRHSGGASLADHAAGHAAPDQRPVSTGWGATGAQR
ncbi:hypothetical protein [Methylobacterium sp. SD21]|uniref:hypothetical protein n=1 Tax=Methylobacterium litchii TaxID=3138810 RepID=UPI00313C2380